MKLYHTLSILLIGTICISPVVPVFSQEEANQTQAIEQQEDNTLAEVEDLESVEQVNATTAETKQEEGRIDSIVQKKCGDSEQNCQFAIVKIFKEDNTFEEIEIELSDDSNSGDVLNDFQPGDEVWVTSFEVNNEIRYSLAQHNRQTPIIIWLIIFLIVTILLVGRKGLGAIASLVATTLLVFSYFIPTVFTNPNQLLLHGFITVLAIVIINQIIGHGINKNSLIGLAGGIVSIIITIALGFLINNGFNITGLGSDASTVLLSLTTGQSPTLPQTFSFGSLFLIAALIGVSGAMDDVTSSQAHVVEEVAANNQQASFWNVYKRSMKIGGEHIISMVNTLFLAYLGAGLPTALVFYSLFNEVGNNLSLWSLLSRDDFVEEIARTILGSFGIILAIPLTTLIATAVYTRQKKVTKTPKVYKKKKGASHAK